MQNGVVKFSIKPVQMLMSLMMILLPVFFYVEMNYRSSVVTLLTYYDEAFTIFCILYILYTFATQHLKYFEIGIIILTIVTVFFGLVGNIKYEIQPNTMAILVDALALFKVSFSFVAFYIIGTRDKNKDIFNYLMPVAKLFLIVAAMFAAINLVVDIGMSGEERYGIRSFCFIFRNEARLGIISSICLLIIIFFTKSHQRIIFYTGLTFFIIICTTKGTNFIIMISYILLTSLWKRTKSRISIPQVLIILTAVIAASRYQIQKYFMNTDSPRMRLIRYGFITAKEYFPLGSGFGTYGSDQAFKNYSPLYIKYGFPHFFGLGPRSGGMFLNDCYLGMIFGQFGYIGAISFILLFLYMFVTMNRISYSNRRVKALTMSIFICLLISAVGSALIKSSIGMFALMTLGLVCGYMSTPTVEEQNESIKDTKN